MWEGMYWRGLEVIVGVISEFLDDGVVSPIGVVFRNVYCFPNKMVGGEVSFPLFLEFFG